jgi:hypothetical protein
MLRRFCAAYAAGALAALVASLVLWIAGRAELTAAVGVAIAPKLTWFWLAPRLVWGGLWALPYPWIRPRRLSAVQKGLLLSLAPSAAQLFWFMPERNLGALGQDLGTLTPAVVLLANATWGWVLARTFSLVGGGGGGGD